VSTQDGNTSLLSLTLPAGKYVILGKATVFHSEIDYECRIVAGDDFDRVPAAHRGPAQGGDHAHGLALVHGEVRRTAALPGW
jgi:hypothetical protein